MVFSLHAFHDLTDEDQVYFPDSGTEVMLVVALPRRLLTPLRDSSGDSSLRLLPSQVLKALRPADFTEVRAPRLWIAGCLILPPQTIRRAYLVRSQRIEGADMLLEMDDIDRDDQDRSSNNAKSQTASLTSEPRETGVQATTVQQSRASHHSARLQRGAEVVQALDCQEYLATMGAARAACEEHGLAPVFHYTHPALAPLILSGGFRMSTQGQGDGGVYFSTLSPASYELGSESYETNIIVDCFGKERLDEYRGKQKLDLVLVYGIEPTVLQQAPGGRDNAKVVGKKMFESMSICHADGAYYLRPDNIFAAIVVDPSCFQTVAQSKDSTAEAFLKVRVDMQKERGLDVAVRERLEEAQVRSGVNDRSIAAATQHVAERSSPFPLPLTAPAGIEKETGDLFVNVEEDDGDNGSSDNEMHASMEDRRTSAAKEFIENPMQALQTQEMARGLTMDKRSHAQTAPLRSAAGARDGGWSAMIQARSSQLTRRLMAMRGSKAEVGTSAASKAADGDDMAQWMENLDAMSGNKYWQNTATGETTWQSPESAEEKELRIQRKSAFL